ncbi:MAG: zinc-dependent peptidase [Planctomycetaceae bacterium]|nr:zinc-dependent peptidase [Planctomycetaceae bacterium]
MIWTWWRNRQRRRLLAEPFPAEWTTWLSRNCRHYAGLSPDGQQRLRNDVRVFVAEKHWEGCNGLTVTDEMRVTIAAHAVLLGLGFPELPFGRLLSVLIYPDTFVAPPTRQRDGIVDESHEPRLGEAWYQGPVVLSWREVREQCIEHPDGRNVVVHEFAHLLDMTNRAIDGIPALDGIADADGWVNRMGEEFSRLVRQSRLGRRSVIDDYGATSEAEFFAVASESFFERPAELRLDKPVVYECLREFYRQDPASRMSNVE